MDLVASAVSADIQVSAVSAGTQAFLASQVSVVLADSQDIRGIVESAA